MKGTVQERFEAKIIKTDSCWEWTAYKDKHGYGKLKVAGRMELAHRVAYQLYIGEIPEKLCCLHKCDNPACCRPDHLFLGTIAENNQDCINKGRWTDNAGEKHWKAKLTMTQIIEIRAKHKEGATNIALAKQFNVVPQTISKIVNYRRWDIIPVENISVP